MNPWENELWVERLSPTGGAAVLFCRERSVAPTARKADANRDPTARTNRKDSPSSRSHPCVSLGSNRRKVGETMVVGRHIETDQVDRLETADHEKAAIGVYAGLIVKRDRLLHDLAAKGKSAGITIISAPKGFGKTALVLQYIAVVQTDPTRGYAQIIDADGMTKHELVRRLDEIGQSAPSGVGPLVVIDNLPLYGTSKIKEVVEVLRAMRGQGFEFVVTCLPTNRGFVAAMGDSALISSQALTVQPREYPDWVRVFTISRRLDVYALTQGVPALVALLHAATERQNEVDLLEAGIVELYGSILRELRRERDALYRIVCTLILMGSGNLGDLERGGIRLRRDTMSRLIKAYPVFGIDSADRAFTCLGATGRAHDRLCSDIAARRPAFADRAVRILMKSGRTDDAVELARLTLSPRDSLVLATDYPVQFALAGHATFITEVFADGGATPTAGIEVGALLAVYVASLTLGNYRTARTSAHELRKRADEISQQVDPSDWDCACAVDEMWASCSGVRLPEMPPSFTSGKQRRDAELLRRHVSVYGKLIGGDGRVSWEGDDRPPMLHGSEMDIPALLLHADRCLDRALHGKQLERAELDDLEDMTERLLRRRLLPIAARMRMTVNTCRLSMGLPIVDERGFIDAGTIAVRESDLPTQLYCLAAEGWQALTLGQTANARFRGQQVLKLTGDGEGFLRTWAHLLERTAYLRETSRVKIRQDAEALDLTQEGCDAADAWSVALHLSAARFDSELAAWYSLNKTVMLDPWIMPTIRRVMDLLGPRCESLRQIVPRERGSFAEPNGRQEPPSETLRELLAGERIAEAGEVIINLFGGFHAERNGHVLTESAWRRKKAAVIAARLVLNLGTFVNRRTIIDELWPTAEYANGRECLYVTLSSLRQALGQHGDGPQYLLAQGEGIALNAEYVYTDIRSFDVLARTILLGGEESSAQRTIESCLKLEELYKGPLYIPDCGNTSYFVRMRSLFATRFIDCMIRGIDAALHVDNLACASWLVESALRQAPTREDLLRRAMDVYNRSGRRREVVALYNGHLHYLKREGGGLPEKETAAVYARIIDERSDPVML